jgi:hypothetical protein
MQSLNGLIFLSPSDLNDHVECAHLTALAWWSGVESPRSLSSTVNAPVKGPGSAVITKIGFAALTSGLMSSAVRVRSLSPTAHCRIYRFCAMMIA